jgi:hypothetical protein
MFSISKFIVGFFGCWIGSAAALYSSDPIELLYFLEIVAEDIFKSSDWTWNHYEKEELTISKIY